MSRSVAILISLALDRYNNDSMLSNEGRCECLPPQQCGGDDSPPQEQCEATIAGLCSSARRSSTGNCLVCCSSHQQQLKAAGCTSASIDDFCSKFC